MTQHDENKTELAPPPIAQSNPDATEILRVWAPPGGPHQLSMRTGWKDPGAWGIMLVDIARHASNVYEKQGYNPHEALHRIRELFDAEWESPTSDARDITDET